MSLFDDIVNSALGEPVKISASIKPSNGYSGLIDTATEAEDRASYYAPSYPSVDEVNTALKNRKDAGQSNDKVSDTYHTFEELYHHRAILFATIVNNPILKDLAWKSKQHDDPNQPMYDGMFIVGIETPEGQATYHYDVDPYWDMFQCKELERAPKYDGHTPADAIERIKSLWTLFIR